MALFWSAIGYRRQNVYFWHILFSCAVLTSIVFFKLCQMVFPLRIFNKILNIFVLCSAKIVYFLGFSFLSFDNFSLFIINWPFFAWFGLKQQLPPLGNFFVSSPGNLSFLIFSHSPPPSLISPAISLFPLSPSPLLSLSRPNFSLSPLSPISLSLSLSLPPLLSISPSHFGLLSHSFDFCVGRRSFSDHFCPRSLSSPGQLKLIKQPAAKSIRFDWLLLERHNFSGSNEWRTISLPRLGFHFEIRLRRGGGGQVFLSPLPHLPLSASFHLSPGGRQTADEWPTAAADPITSLFLI